MQQVKEKGILKGFTTTKKGSASPMTTIPEVAQAMQTLLTSRADELAKKQGLSSDNAR
jgi:hypothetical protein